MCVRVRAHMFMVSGKKESGSACVCECSLSFRAADNKSKMAVLVWFGFDQKLGESTHTKK